MENKLTRELIEREIKASETGIKQFKNAIAVHEVVLKAFEEELAKCPIKTTSKVSEKKEQ